MSRRRPSHAAGARLLAGLLTAALCAVVPARAGADDATAGQVDPTNVGGSGAQPNSLPMRPTPARTAAPGSIAVIGDSISQGTGSNGSDAPSGGIGSPRPAASWATGDHRGLESYADRLDVVRGAPVRRLNLSANGARMKDDFVDQVREVPHETELVLVQMGGNDLCRGDESLMTPVDVYRDQFRAGLDWLGEHRPDALVLVTSIPDIYSLWYVRGAAHRGEQYPVLGFVVSGREGPRAPRSFAENNNKRAARVLWDTLGVVPCKTMLHRPNVPRNAGPTPDPANSAEQRRLRVRAHNVALNEVLEQECGAMLRCRFDDHALFDFVSNRDEHGVLLAEKSEWRFVDSDISTQDHFHPSFGGQRKLAEQAWLAGYDWADVSPPVATVSVSRSGAAEGPSAHGWYTGPVDVEIAFTDDAGVRGVEYRIHGAATTGSNGSPAAWTAVHDDRVIVNVSAEGESFVEARGLDVNGNVGASEIVPIRIDRGAPWARITSPSPDESVVLGAPVVARYECGDVDVSGWSSGVVSCEGSVPEGRWIDASSVGPREIRLTALDGAGHVASIGQLYHVRYAWSGTRGPLAAGHPREVVAGQALPVRFVLADAHGRPAREAVVGVVLIDPQGAEHPATSVLSGVGLDGVRWPDTHGEFLHVVDTRGLEPGVWEVVVRPDDDSEHRVNLLVRA